MRTITRGSMLAALLAAVALTAACAGAPELRDATPVAGARPATAPSTTKSPTTTVPAAPPSGVAHAAARTESRIGGCPVFPRDHFLNATNVDRLPVHPDSNRWTAYLARGGTAARLGVPSSSVWEGSRGGMPFNVVDSRQTGFSRVVLSPDWTATSHRGGYPIPKDPMVEGYPGVAFDKHLLMVDVADCTGYELIQYEPTTYRLIGLHTAMAGTRYRLDDGDHTAYTTNAAGTPMIGQYAMADEVVAGRLAHVIGFCTDELSSKVVWPARSSDGKDRSPDAPPMGTWLRLKADVDLRKFSGQARTIAEALRRHGMVLTDTCGHQFALFGESSSRWNATELAQLRNLTARNFEVVDPTPMKRSNSSFRIN